MDSSLVDNSDKARNECSLFSQAEIQQWRNGWRYSSSRISRVGRPLRSLVSLRLPDIHWSTWQTRRSFWSSSIPSIHVPIHFCMRSSHDSIAEICSFCSPVMESAHRERRNIKMPHLACTIHTPRSQVYQNKWILISYFLSSCYIHLSGIHLLR